MPIYDYRCEDCNARYEVFHKSREVAEDVVCPSCSSVRHRKVMSVPAVAVMSTGGASSFSAAEGCAGGACDNAGGCGCGGGACGFD